MAHAAWAIRLGMRHWALILRHKVTEGQIMLFFKSRPVVVFTLEINLVKHETVKRVMAE